MDNLLDLSNIPTQELLKELGKRQLQVVLKEKGLWEENKVEINLYTPLSNSFMNVHDLDC
ncbi:MAG: hypothetical protein IPL26_29930 [Leptospiraceae bacterium]|nr:hypothetical protein [Leptospiraceae bacterium]